MVPELTENTSVAIDSCDESRSLHPFATFNERFGNEVCMLSGVENDVGGLTRCIDESRSQPPSMSATADDQCGEVFMLSTVADEEPTLVDSSDESRNQFQVTTEESREHKYGGELLKDVYSDMDSCNKSTSQRQNVTLHNNGGIRNHGAPPVPETRTEVFHRQNDTSNDLGNPTQMKAVNPRNTGCKDSEMVQTSPLGVNDFSNESICRDNRCSLSTDQNAQQPVTAVQQDRCIEPTVVNSVRIDKCLVTNMSYLNNIPSKRVINGCLTLSQGLLQACWAQQVKIKRGRNSKEISIQISQTYLLSRSLTSSFNAIYFILQI